MSRPYIINESNRSSARKILAANRDKQSAHLGVSCWENYNIMIASGSTYGILFDTSEEVLDFNDKMAEIIKKSETRQDFIKSFKRLCEKDAPTLSKELENSESWLGTDENYDAIRKMYLENKIEHIQMDILDEHGFKSIKKKLDKLKMICRTFYISNVRDVVLKQKAKEIAKESAGGLSKEQLLELERTVAEHGESIIRNTFMRSISPVMFKDTLVIDSGYGSPKKNAKEPYPQYIFPAVAYLRGDFKEGFITLKIDEV